MPWKKIPKNIFRDSKFALLENLYNSRGAAGIGFLIIRINFMQIIEKYEFIHNVFIDSCVFNENISEEEQKACLKILEWSKESIVGLHLPASVKKELEHKNTPSWVKEFVMECVIICKTDLTKEEQRRLKNIEDIVIGNGKRENYKSDAMHAFMSDKYGKYFITLDNRLIKKRETIETSSTGIKICRPSEFVEILENNKKEWEKSVEWRNRQGLRRI